MSPSYPLTFPISASPFLFPLASLSALLSLTELFQRCLEYIWLCDSSGQHHWHPGDRAWGKYRNLPCVFRSILKTQNYKQADMISCLTKCLLCKYDWLVGEFQHVSVGLYICPIVSKTYSRQAREVGRAWVRGHSWVFHCSVMHEHLLKVLYNCPSWWDEEGPDSSWPALSRWQQGRKHAVAL